MSSLKGPRAKPAIYKTQKRKDTRRRGSTKFEMRAKRDMTVTRTARQPSRQRKMEATFASMPNSMVSPTYMEAANKKRHESRAEHDPTVRAHLTVNHGSSPASDASSSKVSSVRMCDEIRLERSSAESSSSNTHSKWMQLRGRRHSLSGGKMRRGSLNSLSLANHTGYKMVAASAKSMELPMISLVFVLYGCTPWWALCCGAASPRRSRLDFLSEAGLASGFLPAAEFILDKLSTMPNCTR